MYARMIGHMELIVILVITFLVFGGKKLPELGAGLGKAIRSFNKGIKGEEADEKRQSVADDAGKNA